MQILTHSTINEYDHQSRSITRIVRSRVQLITLTKRLPKTYQHLDPLERLNALANLDNEDFQALSEYQKCI